MVQAVKTQTDPALVAHLYRRAGFGITREQVDRLSERDYADIVDFLLNFRFERLISSLSLLIKQSFLHDRPRNRRTFGDE